ncbi:glycosyltransferase [Sphingomonas solaris]|uniref:Glycosyltransferase family 2 protein n=1 Tax=Alterirhizorhabdus solaris TaxID=2529389 RepID=A0A558QSQ2_9SPHN|nr:glycosyltransferase family 2 protein [Sphingomonas solaris]TVV70176.1 glycosyltransferase family 2 protein [Sphingomonas solaris]
MPAPIPVSICIPARNEAASLPALLAALAALDTAGADPVAVIYLDDCSDGSERLLHATAHDFPFRLVIGTGTGGGEANAGRARRAAMAAGLGHAGQDGLLLTTDADSRPRGDWLQATVRALAHADVAAGRIVRAGGAGDALQGRIEAYYDALHGYRRTIDPVPWDGGGHHFSGGANLAFRAAAYRAIDGFRPIPSGEDATALDDAARAGLRVRRDAAMVVETSSRRHGRAPGGLAAALRGIDAGDVPHVLHPLSAAWQYRAHALARASFAALASPPACEALGQALGLTADHVLGVGRDCPNAEAFAMRIVPVAPHCRGLVPLPEAEAALAALCDTRCEQAA